MNREIKLRAWDINNERFWSHEELGDRSLYLQFEDGSYKPTPLFHFILKWQEPEPQKAFIPQQFTGLLDKNGKEIYEGDIVRYTDYKDREIISPVTYEPPYFGVLDINNEPAGPNDLYYEQSDAEVIGNIHEGIFKDNAKVEGSK